MPVAGVGIRLVRLSADVAFAALNLAVTYPMMLWRINFPGLIDPMMPKRKLAGLHE
jgi:hypothetical protein